MSKVNRNTFMLSFVLFLTTLIVGCSHQVVDTPSSSNIIEDNYDNEYQSLLSKAQHINQVNNPEELDFNIDVTIDENKDTDGVLYLIYDVVLEKPKNNMYDVNIGFILDAKMLQKVNSPNIFFSTIRDKRTIDLDPIKVYSYSVSLANPLKDAILDKTFFEIYTDVLVKVSWKSKDQKPHVIYYHKKGNPTSRLSAYLESNKH